MTPFAWAGALALLLPLYTDLKEGLVYDRHLLLSSILFLLGSQDRPSSVLGCLAGLALGWALRFSASALFGGEAFGEGDVLLLGTLGLWHGWPGTLSFFCFASMAMGLAALAVLLLHPELAKKPVPLCPGYILASLAWQVTGRPGILWVMEVLFPS